MAIVAQKTKAKSKEPKAVALYKKMLADKKAIHKHLRKGGTFNELKEKGFRFATI